MAKNRFLHILTRFYTLKTAKNSNQSLWIVYGSIILKKILVAQDTHTHQWFDRQGYRQKTVFLGYPNVQWRSSNWKQLVAIDNHELTWRAVCKAPNGDLVTFFLPPYSPILFPSYGDATNWNFAIIIFMNSMSYQSTSQWARHKWKGSRETFLNFLNIERLIKKAQIKSYILDSFMIF